MGKNSCVFNTGCFHLMARMCLSARSSSYWRGQRRSAPLIMALEECRCIALLANHMSLRLLQERCTAILWEPFQPNRSREKTNHRRDCRRHTQSSGRAGIRRLLPVERQLRWHRGAFRKSGRHGFHLFAGLVGKKSAPPPHEFIRSEIRAGRLKASKTKDSGEAGGAIFILVEDVYSWLRDRSETES